MPYLSSTRPVSLNPAQQGAQRHEYDKAKEERNLAERTFELLTNEKQRIDREWDLLRQRMEPEGAPTRTTSSRIGAPLISGVYGGDQESVSVIRPSRTTLSGGQTPMRTPRPPQRTRIQTEPVSGHNFTESPKDVNVKTTLTPETPEGLAYHRQQYALRDRMRALTIKLEEAEKDLEQKESRLADTRREITQAESAYTDSASRE